MDKEELVKEYNERFIELRKIITSWNFIADWPKDEFNYLTEKILNNLYKSATLDKLNGVIATTFAVHYGFSTYNLDENELSMEVLEWWDLVRTS